MSHSLTKKKRLAGLDKLLGARPAISRPRSPRPSAQEAAAAEAVAPSVVEVAPPKDTLYDALDLGVDQSSVGAALKLPVAATVSSASSLLETLNGRLANNLRNAKWNDRVIFLQNPPRPAAPPARPATSASCARAAPRASARSLSQAFLRSVLRDEQQAQAGPAGAPSTPPPQSRSEMRAGLRRVLRRLPPSQIPPQNVLDGLQRRWEVYARSVLALSQKVGGSEAARLAGLELRGAPIRVLRASARWGDLQGARGTVLHCSKSALLFVPRGQRRAVWLRLDETRWEVQLGGRRVQFVGGGRGAERI